MTFTTVIVTTAYLQKVTPLFFVLFSAHSSYKNLPYKCIIVSNQLENFKRNLCTYGINSSSIGLTRGFLYRFLQKPGG